MKALPSSTVSGSSFSARGLRRASGMAEKSASARSSLTRSSPSILHQRRAAAAGDAGELLEGLRVVGARQRLVGGYQPLSDELRQGLVHRDHAVLGAGVDGLVEHVRLALADQ